MCPAEIFRATLSRLLEILTRQGVRFHVTVGSLSVARGLRRHADPGGIEAQCGSLEVGMGSEGESQKSSRSPPDRAAHAVDGTSGTRSSRRHPLPGRPAHRNPRRAGRDCRVMQRSGPESHRREPGGSMDRRAGCGRSLPYAAGLDGVSMEGVFPGKTDARARESGGNRKIDRLLLSQDGGGGRRCLSSK